MTAQSVLDGDALLDETATAYCTDACYSLLQNFQANVNQRCSDTIYTLRPNSTWSAIGVNLVWGYNMACVKDR